MNRHTQSDELATMYQVARDMGVAADTWKRYVIAIGETSTLPNDNSLESRATWTFYIRCALVLAAYDRRNFAKNIDGEISERAEMTALFIHEFRARLDARQVHRRPVEQIKRLRKRLNIVFDHAPSHDIGWIEAEFPHRAIPEWPAVMYAIRPDHFYPREGQRLKPLELRDWVTAIDKLIAIRKGKGRKANEFVRELHSRLKEEYLWLTGRTKPDWTNNGGLRGGFIDFQKDVFQAAGIPSPSESLLRGRSAARVIKATTARN